MADKNMNLFMKYLTEAPDDDSGAPPDLNDDVGIDNSPPDIDDNIGTEENNNEPPDLNDDIGLDNEDDFQNDNNVDENNPEENESQIDVENLSGKVSAILNQQLYQKFLNLLTSIGNQLSLLKNNNDVLFVITKDIDEINSAFSKLDENVRIYLKNNFMNENYSKNLLFYNKCINLLSLLNESFNSKIGKGIKNLD